MLEIVKYKEGAEFATIKIAGVMKNVKIIDYPDRIEFYGLSVKFKNNERIHKGVGTYWKKGKSFKYRSTENNKDNAVLVGFHL